MKKILLIFGIVTILVSCKTVSNSFSKERGTQPDLNNTKWSLVGSIKEKAPTLQIDGEKINGNTGCNKYFGTVTKYASSGTFSVGKIGSTKMACSDMSAEQNFLNMLKKANKYIINGDNLELYQEGTLLLKFHKVE